MRLWMLLFSRGRRPVCGQLRGYACGAGFRSRLREEDGEREQQGPRQQVCSLVLVLAAWVEAYSGTLKALSRLSKALFKALLRQPKSMLRRC
jgi:hypothetical protein